MKTLSLLLALNCLLSTAYAQTTPATSQAAQAARDHATVTAHRDAIGRAFKEKSKPADMRLRPLVQPVKK